LIWRWGMTKILTIAQAIEEFEFYSLYNDTIESFGENLEDPSLVSDLYDLIDEYEEEFEFSPDQDGDYSESFEKNLIETIHSIVEENEELAFSEDDFFKDDDLADIVDKDFESESDSFEVDLEEEKTEDEDRYD
jgi:hypothetical protein